MPGHNPALRYGISANFHSAFSILGASGTPAVRFRPAPSFSVRLDAVFFLSRFSFLTHCRNVKPSALASRRVVAIAIPSLKPLFNRNTWRPCYSSRLHASGSKDNP
jgi:hypothetical protein